MSREENKEPSPPNAFWPPLAAGVALGLVLLATFLITGHGLVASGFFTRLAVEVSSWASVEWVQSQPYFRRFLGEGGPLDSWISWEIVGLLIGAFAGAVTSGRFRLVAERGARQALGRRAVFALGGGILVGFGARLARGCTSGLGLSGGATLAVAGFLFLVMFFAAGFAVSRLVREEWS